MIRRAAVLLLGSLLIAAAAQAAGKVYVPQLLGDKIAASDTTEFDIGQVAALFDNDETTLVRTPSINPAFVRVEFTEPVRFEHLRIRFTEDVHVWSLAVADSLSDLKERGGSYRALFTDQRARRGRVDQTLEEPLTIKAVELHVQRTTGDDYVHISELQLCVPGSVDELKIERIINRREARTPKGVTDVTGPITVLTDTVVALRAKAVAGGVEQAVDADIRWTPVGDGIAAFGEKPGEFLVSAVGEQRLEAAYGDFTQTITIVGEPRKISNRKPDIEILYIERLPRLDYAPADNTDPRVGWPADGSDVTWRGHVYNWGEADVAVRYEWQLDGAVVGGGEVVVPVGPPGVVATPVDLPWKWAQTRHDLTLTVTPVEPLNELVTANNTLTIQTNAITVGFWVERSLWDYMHEHQHRLPTDDANSFAGWGQRMMRQWNLMFDEAVWPNEYPDGVVERVRLDRVVVVPDFALPLAGGLPSNNPDNRDKTLDMVWGCESEAVRPDSELPKDHWWSPERAIEALEDGRVAARKVDPPFWCGLGYIHEMGHARYLIDTYGFNVHSGTDKDVSKRNILVTDEHGPILGRYMPLEQDIQWSAKYPGQMGGDYWSYSVFETMCWNRRAGWRARGGNCNSPPPIGEFLQDIPARVIFAYTGDDGRPLADAEVWVYRAQGTGDGWYTKRYVDEPAIKARTDAQGRVVLDRNVWAVDGKVHHTFGWASSVSLVRVTYEGQHYFLFEEVSDASLAYNLGHTEEYEFARRITLREGEPSPAEWKAGRNWDAPGTGFGRR